MKRIILYILLIALCQVSCKQILELSPKETPSSNVYWQSENDALAATLGAYSLLRDALTDNNRYYVYGDVPSKAFHITYNSDYAIQQLIAGSYDGVYYGYIDALQDWTKFYKVIAQTNLLIKRLPTMDAKNFKLADRKNYFLGEALYLRAFTYFYISRVWGDVPLVTAAVEDVTEAKQYGREAQAKVLAQCITDLEQAKTLIPTVTESPSDKGIRASLATVLALEAHIYAWMGNYQKCEEMTRDIVNNPGQYNLAFITDSAQFQRISIGRTSESIFEISINYDQNEGAQQGIGERTLYSPFLATRIPSGENVPWTLETETLNKIYDIYGDDTTDLRYKSWFYQVRGDHPMLKKYANVIYKDGEVKKNPRFSNNIIIFRLSDIMLLRAEALYKTGNEAGARILVDRIRARAGTTPSDPDITGDDFLSFLVYEEVRELYAEGHMYYDLIRNDMLSEFNDVFDGALEKGSANYGRQYWPINRDLFKDNPYMKQTPYWSGRL